MQSNLKEKLESMEKNNMICNVTKPTACVNVLVEESSEFVWTLINKQSNRDLTTLETLDKGLLQQLVVGSKFVEVGAGKILSNFRPSYPS